MYQPIAIINDEEGNFVGLRCAFFSIRGIDTTENFNFSTAADLLCDVSLIENFRIVDLNAAALSQYCYNIFSEYSSNKYTTVPYGTQMAAYSDPGDGDTRKLMRLWIGGVRELSHLDTNGAIIKQLSPKGDRSIIFNVIGPRVIEYSYSGNASGVSHTSIIRTPTGEAKSSSFLLIAPTGATKVLSYQELLNTLKANKLAFGNVFARRDNILAVSDASPMPVAGITFKRGHAAAVSSVMLANFVLNGDTLTNIPNVETVIIPDSINKISINEDRPTNIKRMKFPTNLAGADTRVHANFKATAFDVIQFPNAVSGYFHFAAESVGQMKLPSSAENADFVLRMTRNNYEVLDLTSFKDSFLKCDLGSSPKLRGIALSLKSNMRINGEYYGSGPSSNFSACDLSELSVLRVQDSFVDSSKYLHLGLYGLKQPVVTIMLMQRINGLVLKFSTDPAIAGRPIKIVIKHAGISRVHIVPDPTMTDNAYADIYFEPLTKNKVAYYAVTDEMRYHNKKLELKGGLYFNGQQPPKRLDKSYYFYS